MLRVVLIGSDGFVGKAFNKFLSKKLNINLLCVNRNNYHKYIGAKSDLVIDAAGSSIKYNAERRPYEDFQKSACHALNVLHDYPSDKHIHLSSVDIYKFMESNEKTKETEDLQIDTLSKYGFHKKISEEIVRYYSENWLIFRLAGMVGDGLKKGPVFDILKGLPIFVHPESKFQFLSTIDVANIVWQIIELDLNNEIFNVNGEGNISLNEISALANIDLNLSRFDSNSSPRVFNINGSKIAKYCRIPQSRDVVEKFILSNNLS
jgi:nucleoside-diphosphate-sugar epimerase